MRPRSSGFTVFGLSNLTRTPWGNAMRTMHDKLASLRVSKRTTGLLCIALCLAAWGYKAEAAMGLVLVGIALGGTIMGFPMNRPPRVGATSTPTTPPRVTGVGLIKEWLTRDLPLTRYHRALLWCVAMPLIVWWPTRFQLMKAVAENRRGQVALCLALGCDVNAEVQVIPHVWYLGSPGVRTPLYEAIRTSNVAMVRFLLKRGADPNQYCGEPNKVTSPLNLADDPEIVEALRESITAIRERRR